MTSASVIIIGAGWSGLAAASTYLKISPTINLTILDSSDSPGGVWSKSRLYPGLVANSPTGLYEYTDLSMVDDRHFAYDIITGERVQEYLEQYSKVKGIFDKIRFGVHVVKVRRKGELGNSTGWTVQTADGNVLSCDKLIIASGLHSKPRLPSIPQDQYKGVASIHSRDLGVRHKELSSDSTIKSVVVVGGCKSAVEAASIFLSAGKRVHWVIRPSPQGVPIVVLKKDARPNLIAANNTRLFSAFSPSIFDTYSTWYRFMHRGTNPVGVYLRKLFWRVMTKVVKAGPKYQSSSNGRKIEPEGDDFFYDAPYISVLYDSHPFLQWLHDESKIKVHRARPVKLIDHSMMLDNDTAIDAGAVIWCTGWEPSIDFFEPVEARRLGIPVAIGPNTTDPEETHWTTLHSQADQEITSIFPQLSGSPRPSQSPPTYTPFRLHRQILSPTLLSAKDRTIAFVGFTSSSQTSVCSELLALWAVAWLEDLLPQSTTELLTRKQSNTNSTSANDDHQHDNDKTEPKSSEIEHQVSLVNAWMTRRYGGRGARDPEIIMEIQTFFDAIMRDLGLKVYRKRRSKKNIRGRNSWNVLSYVREYLEPYTARDYEGVVEEFLALITHNSDEGRRAVVPLLMTTNK